MNLELDNTHAKVTLGTVEEKEWLADYLSFDTMDWRTKSMKRTRLYSIAAERFPSGFLQPVLKRAATDGISVEVLDVRPPAVQRDPNADLGWLRDYQRDAVEAAFAKERGIIWVPTGGGKTELAVALARAIQGRWLFLVHRVSLLQQTMDRFKLRTGEDAGIVGDGVWMPKRFTVTTFQTLMRKLGTPEGKALIESVDGVIVDECFPAGTLVDGKPIETLRVGDTVMSYDESSKEMVPRRVTRLFRNPVKNLVRVKFSNGESLVCTEGHPFLTTQGQWLTAKTLCGSSVLRLKGTKHVSTGTVSQDVAVQPMWGGVVPHDFSSQGQSEGLLRAVSEGAVEGTTEVCSDAVQGVWCRGDTARQTWVGSSSRKQRVLLAGTQNCVDDSTEVGSQQDFRCEECSGVFCTDAASQSHDGLGSSRADGGDAEVYRAQAEDTWGERKAASCGAQDVVGCAACNGCGVGCGIENHHQESSRVAARIKVGPCLGECKPGCRGGRVHTQRAARSAEGQEENSVFEIVRVDDVEVLEPSSDGQFGGVCAGGVVYNIEVEGTHTYTANGYVVHNCHSTPAETYYRVIQAGRNARYRIGLSGTPLARGDKKSVYTVGALGPVIYRIRPELLMERGVLSRPKIHLIHVDHSQSNFAWDARWQDIYKEGVTENDKRNVLIVEAVKQTPKPALVFVQHVDHGHRLMRLTHKAGMNAEFVYGTASLEQRQASIKRLVRGDIDVLICSVIFQEGVDIPALQSVVIATGGASSIAAIQRVGRGMRMAEGKDSFTVWDVADRGHRWFEKHTKQRIRAYKREGYEVIGEQTEIDE